MTNLASRCIDRQISALTNLHSVVESKDYQTLLTLVINCISSESPNLLIAGVGKNSAIASKVADSMASLGLPAFALNVSHLGHGDYGRIKKFDTIIHISRSGSTREMLEAIEHIRLIRPNVIQTLVHCKPNKPANENLNLELFIGQCTEGDEFELAPTTSTTALLCILDTIAVQASNAIGFKRLDFLKNHPDGALGAMLKAEVQKDIS